MKVLQNKILVFVICFLSFINGCKNDKTTSLFQNNLQLSENAFVKQIYIPEEYYQWISEPTNNLHQSKQMSGFEFNLQYKTPSLIGLQETHGKMTKEEQLSYEEQYSGFDNFTLKIKSDDKSKTNPFESISNPEIANYLYFQMQKEFVLVSGQDTIPCSFYHFEQAYNISPENSILLSFEKAKNDTIFNEKVLVYNDKILKTGPIKFRFKKEYFTNIPKLVIK
ncbi:MAG: hypothetical protein HY951_07135 [Bacteroidia bacterium]|nr:hypothetical protein [Bacteroidia bacterium]